MRSVTRSVVVVATWLLAIELAGCAANPGIGSVSRGAPHGLTLDTLNGSPAAIWTERAKSFAVVTMGNSSCPVVATEVVAEGDDLVSVTFGSSPSNPCTADLAPTTHEFDPPASVAGDAISVEIRFEDWPELYTIALH